MGSQERLCSGIPTYLVGGRGGLNRVCKDAQSHIFFVRLARDSTLLLGFAASRDFRSGGFFRHQLSLGIPEISA